MNGRSPMVHSMPYDVKKSVHVRDQIVGVESESGTVEGVDGSLHSIPYTMV